MAKRIFRSIEEKQKIVAAMQAEIAAGTPPKDAIKKYGVDISKFYLWRRELGGKPTIIEHDGSQPSSPRRAKRTQQPFIVFGSPADLAAFAKEMQ